MTCGTAKGGNWPRAVIGKKTGMANVRSFKSGNRSSAAISQLLQLARLTSSRAVIGQARQLVKFGNWQSSAFGTVRQDQDSQVGQVRQLSKFGN